MHILVINGSPKGKRSNSLQLTEVFVDGLKLAQQRQGMEEPVVETVEEV